MQKFEIVYACVDNVPYHLCVHVVRGSDVPMRSNGTFILSLVAFFNSAFVLFIEYCVCVATNRTGVFTVKPKR